MRQKIAFVFGALTLFAAQAALAPVSVTIKAIEGNLGSVYFNPSEITIDKSVPWQKSKKPEGDAPELEFSAAEGKTISAEMLLDQDRGDKDVYGTTLTLLKMAEIDSMTKRPPMVTWTWGSQMPVFKGVISDLSVKYTMFMPDGTPTRASVNMKMKETSRTSLSKKQAECNCDD